MGKENISATARVWRRLWVAEWDWSKPAFRTMALVIICIASVTLPFGMFSFFHLLDYLGPGLGDHTSLDYIRNEYQALKASGHDTAAIALAGTLLLLLVYRCVLMLHGYIHYQKINATYPSDSATAGKLQAAFPMNLFYTMLLFNILMFLGVALVYSVFGGIAITMGYDFSQGYDAAKAIVAYANHLTHTYVPTLIELPPAINVLFIYSLINFPHYWVHRIAHEYRLPWLLLHRPHHYPNVMIDLVTTNVVVAFPVGFLVMFPYVLFFGAATKLFSAEPLYLQIIILNIVTQIGAATAHHSALYYMGFKYRVIGFIGYLTGTAQYHYLHHASHPVYANHNSNLTNLGAGPCMLWDHVFGTYVKPPVSRPNIGLTGDPALHLNPFRLLMAGLVQIIYEWRNNRDWPTRMKILFGKSDFCPPVSKDFAIHKPI
jgi:sterol desaturase/sphingolipid hydroxylase (fatty acid hydroxylase superfamily)